MKKLPEIFTGVLLVFMISACSQPSSENAAMTETAEQFVERANTELDELSREIGAAEWVRATYITQDTAIIDYFAPLMRYLKEQNAGRSCGW